jgi:NAD(P)-dependent dehydrogenase (short-subunit alcohol dehydrogenase family)
MNCYSPDLLEGKTILVTGASKGLGRACVRELVNCGAQVIAVARTAADLESLAQAHGDRVETWSVDISSAVFLERLESLVRLDGLLNNAGINRVGFMTEQSAEDLDAVMNLNVRALWLTSRAAIPALKRAGTAAIVNMSSQMGHIGSPRRTLYCMSKHAVEGLTKAMAVTEPMMADPKFEEFVMSMIPMRKLATLEEVANACIFLLSDLSASTTGSCLKVDGGWTAH